MGTEDLLAYAPVWPGETKKGVQLEVQVLLDLDSASGVDDFCGGFDVPLEIGGDQSRQSDKHKNKRTSGIFGPEGQRRATIFALRGPSLYRLAQPLRQTGV
jgi:hypothetical protein